MSNDIDFNELMKIKRTHLLCAKNELSDMFERRELLSAIHEQYEICANLYSEYCLASDMAGDDSQ